MTNYSLPLTVNSELAFVLVGPDPGNSLSEGPLVRSEKGTTELIGRIRMLQRGYTSDELGDLMYAPNPNIHIISAQYARYSGNGEEDERFQTYYFVWSSDEYWRDFGGRGTTIMQEVFQRNIADIVLAIAERDTVLTEWAISELISATAVGGEAARKAARDAARRAEMERLYAYERYRRQRSWPVRLLYSWSRFIRAVFSLTEEIFSWGRAHLQFIYAVMLLLASVLALAIILLQRAGKL